jgi:hypothetical protein
MAVSRRTQLASASVGALVVLALRAFANDGSATSTPAGQLTREPRISMDKQRLTIGKEKVTVEYEFLNESNQDIVTDVAFPVPPYYWQPYQDLRTEDSRVWVEGNAVAYETEAKALVDGMDYGPILRGLDVDVASFGHYSEHKKGWPKWPDIERLPLTDKDYLRRLGLFVTGDVIPKWRVEKTYHWRQNFPARQPVHIRHEYKPVPGQSSPYLTVEELRGKDPRLGVQPAEAKLSDVCVDPPLRRNLMAKGADEFVVFQAYWVDHVLTTANTWKKPIKQFELTIETPTSTKPNDRWYPSLCWGGRIQQKDVDHFVATAMNFVPTRELRVMFFHFPAK